MDFRAFTIIFYSLISLIAIGMVFEKQFIAIEDKFDNWIKHIASNIGLLKVEIEG